MNKFIQLLIIFGLLFLSACGPQHAERGGGVGNWGSATLHAIIVANTNDTSIGKSAEVDLQKMKGLAESISHNTGLKLRNYSIDGDQFTYPHLKTTLDELSVMVNDVVIFYYAGHGENTNRRTKWPALNIGENLLEFQSVVSTLESKNPRLFLALADTCNGFNNNQFYFSRPRIPPGNRDTATKNYQLLFLNAQGSVVASGAKPGQLSWSNSQDGGFFTNQLLWNLDKELASSNQPSWTAVMNRATKPIRVPSGQLQEPQIKVSIVGETSVTAPAMGNGNMGGENDSEFQWLLDEQRPGTEPNKWHQEGSERPEQNPGQGQDDYDRSKWH